MSRQTFKALVVEENTNGEFRADLCDRGIEELPAGELLIRVAYSSLNYKDALSASGHKGITRKYPHTPGIDAAGTVEQSQDPRFTPGDKVIVTSFDLGMNTAGGFSEMIRVPADWAVMLPSGLGMRESMILGTAGLTAAISHEILREHDLDENGGPILVTGASGGVGSISVALLSTCGFEVIALSGKEGATSFLEGLGASRVMKRDEFLDLKDRPLMKASFQGVVDTVGGEILSRAIRSTLPYGCVAACGLVASDQLDISLMPFLLRGVTLAGVESGTYPMDKRKRLWLRLSTDWKISNFDRLSKEVTLEELPAEIEKILAGKQMGRVLVRI